jgi:hypothetical protein
VHLVADHSRLLALNLHSSCCRGLLCEVRRSHTSHNLCWSVSVDLLNLQAGSLFTDAQLPMALHLAAAEIS